jgi:16S rRNA (guanine527-N7)-methyltransferase
MAAVESFRGLLEPHANGAALDRLVRYGELLERWSERHNLVSFRHRRELVERHLVDALAARELLGASGDLLDVGSGAGLPGVPLLAVTPEWRGVLVEPRQKRWAFLRVVVRELSLNAEVVRARYQDLGAEHGAIDVITARAVGGYDALLDWSSGRLAAGGMMLVWSTERDETRFQELPGWRVLSSPLPGLTHGRLVQLQPCFT